MLRFLAFLSSRKNKEVPSSKKIEEAVNYSVQTYKNTYLLLERYDKEAPRTPQDLVKPRHLQDYLQAL